MAKRKSEGPQSPPNLIVSKEAARQNIKNLIEQGKSIIEKEIQSKDEFEEADSSKSKWSSYCYELFSRYFDNLKYAEDFKYTGLSSFGVVVSRGGLHHGMRSLTD